jgi:uncharacterized protein YndB with AHSA1/START domain
MIDMNTQIITKMKIMKPANEVFEAIVDPEQMSNFWFSSGTGRVEQGRTITWRYDEYNAEGTIHVIEVEENKKIVFSWGEDDQETFVSITLIESDNLSTIVGVIESGLKEDDPELVNKMIGQKEGWVYMLTCLKGYMENGVSTLRASLVF